MGLSLKQMKETLASGGSVLHNGRLISNAADLPTAAELAETEEEKQVAADDLDAQIAALQAQKAKLSADPAQTDADKTAKADDTAKKADAKSADKTAKADDTAK